MKLKSPKNLKAYQRAYALAMEIFNVSRQWPSEEKFRPARLHFSNCGYGIYPARGGSPSVGASFPKDAKPYLIAQGGSMRLK